MSTIAASHAAIPRRSAPSPLAGFWRLAWKEYRTIRPLWAMLAGLTVLAQCFIVAIVDNQSTVVEMLFFSLVMPVLFAVGTAGIAFAGEREEGTIEFLRAAPIPVGQVFTAKLLAVAIGAALMFGIVIVSAILCTRGLIAAEAEWGAMQNVWIVSAIEAIAWGTLFSLLGSRPIIAVILTLIAVSTCDHLFAWASKGPASHLYQLESYIRATPWRLLTAAFVLALDIFISRRWLASIPVAKNRDRLFRKAEKGRLISELPSEARDYESNLFALSAKRDRGAMFGRLIWQTWRQSWRMMLLMLILFPVISLPVITMPLVAAIMGSLVFLPDQEQRRYRFFTEHEAPPRMVWLARQIPWLAALAAGVLSTIVLWQFLAEGPDYSWPSITKGLSNWPYNRSIHGAGELQLGFVLGVTLVACAGGQWVSMLIRSGILAAFSAVVIGGLLYGWALLMLTMHLNLVWSLLPIAVMFLWASWLRAPDWVSENRRWTARAKVAAAVMIPAAVLVAAVADFRVHQVPDVSPGFDVATYERQLQANLAAGRATAELYREAAHRLTKRPSVPDSAPASAWDQQINGRPPTSDYRRWLARSSAAIPLLLEAGKRPVCLFDDPRTQSRWPFYADGDEFAELLVASARQMEADGDFDGALDRYFATFNVISQTDVYQRADFSSVFRQIQNWGAQRGQSSDRIRRAIKRVKSLDSRILKSDDMIASSYVLGRRVVEGESMSIWLFARADWHSNPLWNELMPWEKQRAVQILNLLTAVAKARLQQMQATLDGDEEGNNLFKSRGLAQYCWSPLIDGGYFATTPWTGRPADDPQRREEDWLKTTWPDMTTMAILSRQVATDFARFETQRRATIIVLAIEAYRLDHGALPKSLSELAPDYVDKVPLDPYSGLEFKYYADGIPAPPDVADKQAFDRPAGYTTDNPGFGFRFNRPVIWSTGPCLTPQTEVSIETDKHGDAVKPGPLVVVGYQLRGYDNRPLAILPNYTAWSFGAWFPIPELGIGRPVPGENLAEPPAAPQIP